MKDCFGQEIVNDKRQKEVDIVKGIAIFFMVWCHTLDTLGGDTSAIPNLIIDDVFAGPLAAPVFMMAMGIGMRYTKKSDATSMARRGVGLLVSGYLLNIARYIIPRLLTYAITGDGAYISNLADCFFEVDILQFAGLSFLLMALLKKLRLGQWKIMALSALMLIAAPLLKDVSTGIYAVDCIFGLFWKSNDFSYFTLLHWFVFPAAGYVFGDYLKRCKDKGWFYKNFIIAFMPAGAVCELIATFLNIGLLSDYTSYFYFTVIDGFFMVALVVSWMGAWYFISEKLSAQKPMAAFEKLMNLFSKYINNIYCVHWTLIGFVGIIQAITWKTNTLAFMPGSVIAFIIFLASYYLSKLYVSLICTIKSAVP